MKKEILNKLKAVKYPGLDKNIVELRTIDAIKKNGNTITITLNIANQEAFPIIEGAIKDLLKEYEVEVKLKAQPKKNIHYGSTANPNNRAPYAKNVIAVTSGKGGVGKSTVSTNLSIALAQKGYKVGLLDADVYGPDIPRMVGVEHEKLRWGDNDKIIPSQNFGIKIMSVGLTTPSPDTPLVWRSSVAVSALIQFLEDVDWGELDFLVIDMPPGTGDIQLTMAQELPITAGVLVTTPQMVAADDVSRAIMMFKDIGVHIGGLIENMSYFITPDTGKRYDIFGSDGGKALSIQYDIPFLGQIPLEMEIRSLSDEGMPPVAMGEARHKTYYQEIVENLLKTTKFNLT
ncbi:ATP-binding protein involved in chromosome partitioning [Nitratiruptor sp. YY08-26]|uniref:Mrp/NBP35 family ATP-binding protein n=1 Tax=unclassified Nitratiruptor TaxID=2624044 RepID=UPI001916BB30|nr:MULTISPECIES: Mrp/NBP35 family ATP-binding protein [unclassified Nitratiruptor]BCD63118.1 ATP-binding protein involved in chromosome partitioning [Nitratiruptor sp. YY08-13]BCD67053.1 ATP-binding protein involved in chromosome partitioning [Nitratiruptor sp. YY08-26]